jgi:hypothetical protein
VRGATALTVVAACLLAGCGGGGGKPELAEGMLRLGAVRGPTAWDADVLNGLRAGVRALNRGGGIDQKVRLTLVVGEARRLRAAGVRVLVLPCDARLQAESAAVLRRRETFTLEPCNTALWRRFPALWPVSVAPHDEARALVDYAHDQKYEGIAVVGEGRMARAVRAQVLHLEGLRLAPLRQADAVVVALAAPFAQAAVARLRARGIDAPILATHGMDDKAAIARDRADLQGVVFTTFGFPDPGSELDELDERYRALTGRYPDSTVAALGYDAAYVLEYAAIDAGSTRPAALAASMPGLEPHGATGNISYPEHGGRDPSANVAIVRIAGGGLELIDRVGV